MLVEALEKLLLRCAVEAPHLLQSAIAISFSGQQHGSVWWSRSVHSLALTPSHSLVEQLRDQQVFVLECGPIWMDASTSQEVATLTDALGGVSQTCQKLGNPIFERFTAPQIAKILRMYPRLSEKIGAISLISSALPTIMKLNTAASRLSPIRFAPIDAADGAGTSLVSLCGHWNQEMLTAIASIAASNESTHTHSPTQIQEMLPSSSCNRDTAQCNCTTESKGSHTLAETSDVAWSHDQVSLGVIGTFWRDRIPALNPNCEVICGTGDNPAALIGLGLNEQGHVAISLGTSDTLYSVVPPNSVSRQADPANATAGRRLTAYPFRLPHPLRPNLLEMRMFVYRNASCVRDLALTILGRGTTWSGLDDALATSCSLPFLYSCQDASPTTRVEKLVLAIVRPFPEITPHLPASPSLRFYLASRTSTQSQSQPVSAPESWSFLRLDSETHNLSSEQQARLLLETQIAGLLWSLNQTASRLIITGGGSKSTFLVKSLSTAFGLSATILETVDHLGKRQPFSNAAAYGAAIRARYYASEALKEARHASMPSASSHHLNVVTTTFSPVVEHTEIFHVAKSALEQFWLSE